MKRVWIVVLIVLVLAGGVAFAVARSNKGDNATNDGSTATATSTAPSSSAPTQTNEVTIENMSFSPAKISVKKGTKVTWTNKDDTTHTVTSDTGKAMDSGSLDRGESYSVSFDTAGTFTYHCSFHTSMTGSVEVTE